MSGHDVEVDAVVVLARRGLVLEAAVAVAQGVAVLGLVVVGGFALHRNDPGRNDKKILNFNFKN